MQAATAFGKRKAARPQPAPPRAAPPLDLAEDSQPDSSGDDWALRPPLVTIGLIAGLVLIYCAELFFGFDNEDAFSPGLGSLRAFGGSSLGLVLGAGEWWRIFVAPLLHANLTHILGNAVALLLAGWILERVIGHSWFAALFVIGALGGSLGSLTTNSPRVLSVGASGAITALLATAFVCSFIFESEQLRRRMQRLSLRLLVPSLVPAFLPLASHTDYGAHFGGAIAGVAMGFVLRKNWPESSPRPKFRRLAACIAVAGVLASSCAGLFIAGHYSHYASEPAVLIPKNELPQTLEEGKSRSADLVDRYPRDPRAHFYRAMFFFERRSIAESQSELRAALDLQKELSIDYPPRFETSLQLMLAVILVIQGRTPEAKIIAQPACSGPNTPDLQALRDILHTHGVCT